MRNSSLRIPFLADTHPASAIGEFREMKMQPSLERALRHKEILGRRRVAPFVGAELRSLVTAAQSLIANVTPPYGGRRAAHVAE